MRMMRAYAIHGLGAWLVMSSAGCALLHELKPHRLSRWNRGVGMESGFEAYYSVRDPLPADSDQALADHVSRSGDVIHRAAP